MTECLGNGVERRGGERRGGCEGAERARRRCRKRSRRRERSRRRQRTRKRGGSGSGRAGGDGGAALATLHACVPGGAFRRSIQRLCRIRTNRAAAYCKEYPDRYSTRRTQGQPGDRNNRDHIYPRGVYIPRGAWVSRHPRDPVSCADDSSRRTSKRSLQ